MDGDHCVVDVVLLDDVVVVADVEVVVENEKDAAPPVGCSCSSASSSRLASLFPSSFSWCGDPRRRRRQREAEAEAAAPPPQPPNYTSQPATNGGGGGGERTRQVEAAQTTKGQTEE